MTTSLKTSFSPLPDSKAAAKLDRTGAIVLLVGTGNALGELATALDKKLNGQISAALKATPTFKAGMGETLKLHAPHGLKASRIVLLGMGKAEALKTENDFNTLGAHIYSQTSFDAAASVVVDLPKGYNFSATQVAQVAAGAGIKSYRFDKYRTKESADKKPKLKTLEILTADAAKVRGEFKRSEAIIAGINFLRDLANEPPNVINPPSAAAAIKKFSKHGIKVTVLDEKQCAKLGMGCMLAVGQASETPPRLVTLEYYGAKNKKAAPLALVGKGVTFDTGGLSIKTPYSYMYGMKFDMSGAALTAASILSLALRKAKVNVVGVCGFVENSISDEAYRPDDILTSMSGQTVEVVNTDAEGRIVLADCVHYAQVKFKPAALLDFATLTGAVITALGHEYAGVMSNNDELYGKIEKASKTTGEKVWRLPLDPAFDKQLDSDVADMKNIGSAGEAGTITGGHFIGRFIKPETKWAHLDVAGMMDAKSGTALSPKGSTGYGVRLVNELVDQFFAD